MSTESITPASIGESISYDISSCVNGGFVVWVDGRIYAACTGRDEAIAIMGRVAAAQFADAAEEQQPQKPAAQGSVGGPPLPVGREPAGLASDLPAVLVRPREEQSGLERARATVALVLAMLVVGVRGVVGV